ncbi:MAG: SIS domain-containing protein [Armatimonadetes bacterium]|nr:SIS domain-containing protein [Armatimonadota bacterium]
MYAERYYDRMLAHLQRVRETQMGKVHEGAKLLADAIENGHSLFAFGCSHASIMTQEIYYRAGGLMLVNAIFAPGLTLDYRPVLQTSQIERMEGLAKIVLDGTPAKEGDVLLLFSTSGRNAVPVEMALEAKERGMTVIAITSMPYSGSVSSRHRSGKRLFEIADLVLDNEADAGDALLEIPGVAQKVGPVSTLASVALLDAMIVQAVADLSERGVAPPIYMSGNLDGGDEYNRRMLDEYKDRIYYL